MKDKYKGATPGPWRQRVSLDSCDELTTDILGEGNYTIASDVDIDANAELICDAPMLAERVETQAETIQTLEQCIKELGLSIKSLAEQNERMLRAITGLIQGEHVTATMANNLRDLITEIDEGR